MFYRLVTIDALALPAPMTIGDTAYRVDHGGLLLEPPDDSAHAFAEGHGILKFFGLLSGDMVEFIGSSSASYRWRAPGVLDFSRTDSTKGARFSGLSTGEGV